MESERQGIKRTRPVQGKHMKIRIDENETPKKILEAALKLISENGYAKVSMRDIAREAGVAISQIAYYYRNKEGLFLALVRNVKKAFVDDFTEKTGKINGSDEFITFLCEYAKESIVGNPDIHRLRFEFSTLAMASELFRAEFGTLVKELSEIIAKDIEERAPSLEITKTCGALRIAEFIVIFIFGVSSQYLTEGRDPRRLENIDMLKTLIK